jgi:hypothetical protein
MDPGPIYIIFLSPVYFTRILLLFSSRYTHNLCFKQTGDIDNLIVSWEQSTWLFVCRFRVAIGWRRVNKCALVGVLLSQSASPSVICLSSSRSTLNLGFLTEGKLAAILIIPFSWGSQRAGHSPRTRTSDLPHQPGASASRYGAWTEGGVQRWLPCLVGVLATT